MSKHTKGPWNKCLQSFHVEDSEGKSVAHVQNMGYEHGAKRWERQIEECEANARLIAAAPEMLCALEDLYKFLGTLVLNEENETRYKAIGDLIKKAGGEK